MRRPLTQLGALTLAGVCAVVAPTVDGPPAGRAPQLQQVTAPAASTERALSDLAAKIDAILADPRMTGSQAAVTVRSAASGEQLYARNADRRLLPASNNKLLTSAAAIEVLGPDYRFSTGVHAGGQQQGSVLLGSVYLRGTGDPTTLAADYDALAAKVAAAGIKTVTGNLVADDTAYDSVRLGSDWAWDDEPYYYAAEISALTVAPNTDYDAGTVIVEVRPGAAGSAPTITTVPPTAYVRFDNRAKTGAIGTPSTISVDREHRSNTIVVTGSIPAGGSTFSDWASVVEPTGYAAAVFRDALTRHGVRVLGGTKTGATPAGARQVAVRESMPLSQLLVPFMKLSNNGHAETLIKAMGRKVSGKGTWDAGLAAAAPALRNLGVNTDIIRRKDGSGLSRQDMLTSDEVANLLKAAQSKPWFSTWYESLPIAGAPDRFVGGTLRSRMRGTAAENNVHAKTGSLTGVTALSGYVTSADGERLIFSILLNNYLSGKPADLEDRIAITLATYRRASGAAVASVPRAVDVPLGCRHSKTC